MLEYYWLDGQYVVADIESGNIVDSFINLEELMEECPEIVAR